MTSFLLAIAPIVVIVALGRGLAWRRVVALEGWRAVERLAYVLLFPALIIRVLANAPFESAPWRLAVAMLAGQVILGAIGLASRMLPGISRPATGAIIQSNVRWNTFVALSLGSALFGEQGLALVAIAAAAMIPTANVLSVLGLTAHAENAAGERPAVVRNLLTNPLIIACAIGGLIAASGWTLPQTVDDTLRILAQATIGIGLLAAGAGVDLAALQRAGLRTLSWSLVRILGLPAVVLTVGVLIGLQGTPLAIAAICASTPTATNGYILSRQLGGDATLSANLIAVQTVLSALTMPAIWFVAHTIGMLG